MNNIKEISLRKALEATACRELPKAFNENGVEFWIRAIALVRKRNGTQSYCLVEHRADGMLQYTQDFGLPSPIFGLISIHPYIMLDKTKYGVGGGCKAELIGRMMRMFPHITNPQFFHRISDEEFEQWKIRYAMENQRQTVERMSQENVYEDDGTDENGFRDITSSGAYAQSRNGARKTLGGNELIGEDGVKEEFKDINSESKVAEARKKVGRPKKNK